MLLYLCQLQWYGCTRCSTRIGSCTITIYYVHCRHSMYRKWSSAGVLLCWHHTHIYFHMKVDKISAIKGMVEDYISHVQRWLASNRLWLNPDKMTRWKWCGVCWLEVQVHSISHHLPLITRRSLHQTLFVTLECNFEPTWSVASTHLSDLVVKSTMIPRCHDLWSSAHSQLIPAPHH